MTVSPTASPTDSPIAAPIEPRNASEARLLANVNARAKRLYEDGYRAKKFGPFRLTVIGPTGASYELDARKRACTCLFFTRHRGRYACKHLLGAVCLLRKQADVLAHNARMWEAMG